MENEPYDCHSEQARIVDCGRAAAGTTAFMAEELVRAPRLGNADAEVFLSTVKKRSDSG
jgi:hypothetical protein